LVDEPEQVNDNPYNTWIFCVKADDLSELDQLLDADAYQLLIEQ
jgi:glycine cleavage system H protein